MTQWTLDWTNTHFSRAARRRLWPPCRTSHGVVMTSRSKCGQESKAVRAHENIANVWSPCVWFLVHLPILKAGDVWAPSSGGEEAKHFCLFIAPKKLTDWEEDRKELHSRRTYLAAGAASSCPVFSVASTYFSLSSYTVEGTEEGRERNWKGERGEIQVHTPPDPSNKSLRLVSSVLGFTVAKDWMTFLLSAPGVAACSLCWVANLTLALRFDLIHLFFNLATPKVSPSGFLDFRLGNLWGLTGFLADAMPHIFVLGSWPCWLG